MQRSLRVLTVLAAVASAASLPGCGMPIGSYKADARDTWSRTYTIDKNGEVNITNVNGRVEVEGVDGSTVSVDAERIARGATEQIARDLLPKIAINERSTPELVQIETGRMQGIWIGASFEVRYHVKVPRNVAVRASTVNGGVRLRGLDGRVVAHTTNGGVTASALSGALEARTVNGGVSADFSAIGSHDISLSTVNGGVHISVPPSAKATVNATWVNGGFSPNGVHFEVRDSGKRHFEGLLNGGGTPINLNTVNGGIHIGGGNDAESEADPIDPRLDELSPK